MRTPNEHDSSSQELRRDMRFSVNQAARIVRPGQGDIACEIRDFCLGGLFLKYIDAHIDFDIFDGLEGVDADIVFIPGLPVDGTPTGKPERVFRIQAQLKRASPTGIGVAFTRPPIDALRALQKLRMAGHRQRLQMLTGTPDHQNLRTTCTTLLRETLIQTHDHLSRLIVDKLHLAALHELRMGLEHQRRIQ